jgi:hypothetical protein
LGVVASHPPIVLIQLCKQGAGGNFVTSFGNFVTNILHDRVMRYPQHHLGEIRAKSGGNSPTTGSAATKARLTGA